MNNFDILLNEIIKVVYCPICGKKYKKNQIRIRGFFDGNFIFHNLCSLGHNLYMIAYLNIRQTDQSTTPKQSNEVRKFKESLNSFNGDFRKIFE
ncbi:hypothetical protein A3F08_00440 [Candidatus Berkelbacteria bacterium RIFCSPHIGHO2_12_FULL_36_9]|uniref:Uncharacterized protein n=1 Tax=Candidatus Berkelbacteria bacterium RIFCSPHIGHO2_12_FULL_36_9 TaxID=1797469 RepID=A0A1F5EKE8_9BACT|nr:MAG: hypothetical protein A3F08_00440 [Candidatus Berkelbacteria bacterium RIFCSPHIGHO2_12_FULL_36_9]